ncbi:MAG: family 20 glycosylhydrolase [Marinilabilia sp.]
MKKSFFTVSMLMLSMLWGGCQSSNENKSESLSIIPRPQEIKSTGGQFTLNGETRIILSEDNEENRSVATFLADLIAPSTGFQPEITEESEADQNVIALRIDEKMDGKEGHYRMTVSSEAVEIIAPDAVGLFYGVQSLRQLLPPEIESENLQSNIEWKVPGVKITDEPAFEYRGLHLDVGRHFFPVSFIKKYIDLLAMHKMNKFHWHLTEDQGWRLEIKQYPKLQEIASQRKETLIGHGGETPFEYDGEPYGGYYTQEEAREIVEYAAERHITVIPEIEMPGHARAALAAYPELGCTGGPYEVATRWGVFEDVYCAGNEQTFEFLENVLLEVMDIFPSEYIHIGGDESPKSRWEECPKCQARIAEEGLEDEHELQSYFITRMEKFLNKHDRNLIGWDEILEGGLAPEATVMSWRGTEGGIEAAKMGHDVIMTPNSHLYLDHYQNDPEEEPLAIGGYLTLEKVYSYNPVPEALSDEEARHILGAQGNVWTEYMKTSDHVEYMAYPRASALSEVVWTNADKKDFKDFLRRMEKHYQRLDQLNVNYFYEVPKPESNTEKAGFLESVTIELEKILPGSDIRYTTDGTTPDETSKLYSGPITVDETTEIKAITVKKSGETSSPLVIPVTRVDFTSPVSRPEKEEKGLKYAYHEGLFQSVKEIPQSKVQKEGITKEQLVPDVIESEQFGFVFSGYFKAEQEGLYHFHLTSDDGSIMKLNGEELIDNDGLHTEQTVTEPVALREGYYEIEILFSEGGGGYTLNLEAEYPDGSRKELTPEDFVL